MSSSSRLVCLSSPLFLLALAAPASAEPEARSAAPAVVARVASSDASAPQPSASDASPWASEEPAETTARKPGRLDVMGQVGALGRPGYSAAVVGATALLRRGPLAYGATFEASSSIFSGSRFGEGLVAGWSYRPGGGVGLDLLATAGAHHYEGEGRGLLSNDPGISGTLPFVGARARFSYQLGSASRRFQLGLTAFIDQDLGRKRETTTYTESFTLFSEDRRPVTSEHTIGFTTTGLTLDLGATFD